MTIGQRIKSRREQLNMSQDELAKKCGYSSRSTINKIELDQRNLPQPKVVAMATALGVHVGYLFGITDGENSTEASDFSLKRQKIMDMIKEIPEEHLDWVHSLLRVILAKNDLSKSHLRFKIEIRRR